MLAPERMTSCSGHEGCQADTDAQILSNPTWDDEPQSKKFGNQEMHHGA
jgi:hypothetical protein